MSDSSASIWHTSMSRSHARAGQRIGKGKMQSKWNRGKAKLWEENRVEERCAGVDSNLETSQDIGLCPVESSTEFVAETLLPTRNGKFRLRGYRHKVGAISHEMQSVWASNVVSAVQLYTVQGTNDAKRWNGANASME